MSSTLSAGVVIVTYKRHDMLIRALDHWERSIRSPEQLVIVDASPDAPVQREKLLGRYPDLFGDGGDYLCAERPSTTKQRNLGLDRLQTDIACFADDDTLVSPHYLTRIMEVFEADPEQAIGGVQGVDTKSWRIRHRWMIRDALRPLKKWLGHIYVTADQAYPNGRELPSGVNGLPLRQRYFLWGACMNLRTDFTKECRFDENMLSYAFAEDFDISFRIGRDKLLVGRTDAEVVHAVATSGRPSSVEFILFKWLNLTYLIEKHLAMEKNRVPLQRRFELERLKNAMTRVHPNRLYAVVDRMMSRLQGQSGEDLVDTYLRLQRRILDGRGSSYSFEPLDEYLTTESVD